MSDDFVHLHVHSEYSLLDGLGTTAALARRAAELGQSALALTDHGVMHGAIEFVRACRGAGVKPLLGVEAYLTTFGRPKEGRDPELDKNRYHLLLLAENMTGYRNLLQICSDAQLDGYYYRPRIDAAYLETHAEGLICTSGCLAAELPSLLKKGQEAKALERLQWYRDVFGPDRWYVEFQEHDIPELTQVNKQLFAFAHKYDMPMVVTNDVHYVREEDARPHDMLLCVQTSSLVSQQDRMRMSSASYFLKTADQMRQTFLPLADLPGSAFANTVKIAEMCNVDPEDDTYHLPDIPIPDGYTYESYLAALTEEGIRRRYGSRADDPAVQAQVEHELKIIHEMGFDVYFLIVWDLTYYAQRRGIWYNVRGSGAGSIVAYAIGITNLDPLRNKLIFERFLNPGRVTMPDFDLDFPDDQREELIRYTVDKYGSDRVAQIVTFGRMKARAAVRDVGRALDVPLADVDRLAKLIPAVPGKPVTIKDVLTEGHEFYSAELAELYQGEEYVKNLLDSAAELEGVARHSSIHAAAVIIADKPLVNYTPLMRPPKSAVTDKVTQYEFPILESIGLLKVDFLGLATLSLMREATRLIRERHGVSLTLDTIPIDDPKIYEFLSTGDVMGVFQVEGAGMRRLCMDLHPTEFDHITAIIALYRPGPMDFIPEFISVLHGEKKAEYVHKTLEPILSETMGVCISGESLVMDARSGRRYRIDELSGAPDFVIQGIDEQWRPATGRVTHWIDSGYKSVYRVTLRSGAQIKVTGDHRLLSEDGWRPLMALKVGDRIGTPPMLYGPSQAGGLQVDRRKLRILAYLIADGSLTSGTMVDFVSKEPAMLSEYRRCLAAFDGLVPKYLDQIHDVTRIGVAKDQALHQRYHAPNSLLAWLRDLGLKYPSGSKPGGAHSRDKFIPGFVFELSPGDIAFFLASLWDGDGYIGTRLCHYRTISSRLAEDVRLLLLRLGIAATIHTNYYRSVRNGFTSERIPSYQVTVYDTARLAALLQPAMVSAKSTVVCEGVAAPTVSRSAFMEELARAWPGSQKALMRTYGFDRQHFRKKSGQRARIPGRVVEHLAHELNLSHTLRDLNVSWQEILEIEPSGVEHVYDLTVEGLHSFVANGVIVHNCVYQEQVIQILTDIAGYTAGEADLVRRAISKKKKSVLDHNRELFAKGAAEKSGISRADADTIWDALMGFARYGFNRAHAADYAVIVAQTAYLKAYYPVEYMAALLTIERHDTEKVGVLIAECRRMGIEVLPPSVNLSANTFTVESLPAGRLSPKQLTAFAFPIGEAAAIRMGLDAVKNVGEGPVGTLLAARGAQPFASLSEFAERVDLRQVNRRGLECLIKVGALDEFADRGRLMAAIDRVMSTSANSHEAAEIGQLTLFAGDDLGSSDDLLSGLPAAARISGKEALAWEKELIGVYVSSHPLQTMTVDLVNVVTHSSGDITEDLNKAAVVLAGMIMDVRTITTKKGDTMAFVRLEDLQGQVEVTVFPRLWEQSKGLWLVDKIVIVRGKVDVRSGRAGVVADSVQDYVPNVQVLEDKSSVAYRARQGGLGGQPELREQPAASRYSPPAAAPRYIPPATGGDARDEDDGPDSAEASPFAGEEPDWLAAAPSSLTGNALPASGDGDGEHAPRPLPPAAKETAKDGLATNRQAAPATPADRGVQAQPHATGSAPASREATATSAPATAAPAPPGHPSVVELPAWRTVHITFRRSGSLDADRRRLADLVETLGRYSGQDRFEITVEAAGVARYQLDFPNNRTSICAQLEGELTARVGRGGWRMD